MTTTEPLRILIVDDSSSDAKLLTHELRRVLEAELVVERVENEAELRAALARRWDLAICDWTLPAFSGLGALHVVAELGRGLPCIIVSGTVGEERAVEAMRAGASDYILKDRLERLGPAILRELRERQEREGRARAEESLNRTLNDRLIADSQNRMIQQRFRALIEKSHDALLLVAPEGPVVYASAAIRRIAGYEPTRLIGMDLTELVTGDDERTLREVLREAVSSWGRAVSSELLIRDAAGARRWVELTASSFVEDPAVGAIVVNLRERHEAGIMGVVEGDLDGGVRKVNDTFLRIVGRDRDDVEGQRAAWRELLPPDLGRDGVVARLASVRRPDGTSLSLLVSVAILDATRYLGFVTDIGPWTPTPRNAGS